jgi:uncharacterized protein (TIGR04255 family)
MTEHPNLARAPIIEALIDFRVEPDPALAVEDLKKLGEVLGAEAYPEVRAQKTVNATLQLESDSEPLSVSSRDHIGFVLKSADQLRVVQAQRGGFSFSRLPPYANWDDLISGARFAWEKYVQIAKPRRVTRLAVRTINRIELPRPTGELREWIRIVPDIPAVLPQSISEMFVRFVVPVPAEQAVVILTEALPALPATADRLSAILDVDVFREAEFPVDDHLWAALNPLRRVKNDFFFQCLTPRTLELFR